MANQGVTIGRFHRNFDFQHSHLLQTVHLRFAILVFSSSLLCAWKWNWVWSESMRISMARRSVKFVEWWKFHPRNKCTYRCLQWASMKVTRLRTWGRTRVARWKSLSFPTIVVIELHLVFFLVILECSDSKKMQIFAKISYYISTAGQLRRA